MRLLTRAAATAVAAAAVTTALATPAAATEAPAADGCVMTYLDGRPQYRFSLAGIVRLAGDTVQIGPIPGPVTVNPDPALGLGTSIVLNEAGHAVALVTCVV